VVDSGKGAGGAGGTGAGPFSEQRLVAKLSEYSEYPFFPWLLSCMLANSEA